MDMISGVAGIKLGLALSLVIALSAGPAVAQQQPAPAPIEQAAPAPAPVAVEAAPVPELAPALLPPAILAQPTIDIEAADDPLNTIPAPQPLAAQQASNEHADDTLPHDLSPWGMFMGADYVVKGVMIGLLLASIATWTVWLAKTLELIGAKARIRRALKALQSATSLAEAGRTLDGKRGAGATLVLAAQQEVARAEKVIDFAPSAGLKERVSSHLHRIEAAAGRRLTKGTGVLATIGSVSPFVGLFGTVWGIMNAFIGISQAQSSSLAVVAPGIAEALLATAMGLVAAIPAVVFYNAFARSITGYRQLLTDASAAIERLISSDLDHRYVARNHPDALQTLAAE
jgi:biopolymer transport protein ExbB